MDGADLDRVDLDTRLARLLLQEGRLPLEVLRAHLQEARERRAAGGPSLARSLVARGLLTASEVTALVRGGAAAAPPPHAAAPRRVGDYELLQELGSGGMGRVHLARHVTTGARYALKTMAAADAELIARFQREGEGQARVDDHPSIVKVHGLGRDGATLYLVMDLVEGGTLAARLREGPPPPAVAAAWVRDLALAVEHAHARGVLHRDLKPENVLFDGEAPKLVDFGLAKLVDARSLTATGSVLGTPAYMAPEQVDGARGAVTPATDVYGLGAVLYACLTGRPPFAGGAALKVMLQVVEEAPTPPRRLRPEVPAALEAVCLRALEKDPARRFASAAALAEALEVAARAPARGARAWSAAVAAAGATIVLVTLGALAWGWPRTPGPAPPGARGGAGALPPRPAPATTEPAREAVPAPTAAAVAPRGPARVWLSGRPVDGFEDRQEEAERLTRSTRGPPPEEVAATLERAKAILLELVATPPSSEHGRVYRELAGLYGKTGAPRDTVDWLARGALVGECESSFALGVCALAREHRPDPYRGGFAEELPELDPTLLTDDPRARDALAAACFVLAVQLVDADGVVVGRSRDEEYAARAERALAACAERGVAAPDYARAYRRVWEAFPRARPSTAPPARPHRVYLEVSSGDLAARLDQAWSKGETFFSAGGVPSTEDEAGAARERLVAELLACLETPPSREHARAYRLLGYQRLAQGKHDRAVECLARSALMGEGEAAAILGLSLLPDDERPEEIRVRWDLQLAERGARLGGVGFGEGDAVALACLALALTEPLPGGRLIERARGKSGLLHAAHRWVEDNARRRSLPDYSAAYGRVWAAFPTARPRAD